MENSKHTPAPFKIEITKPTNFIGHNVQQRNWQSWVYINDKLVFIGVGETEEECKQNTAKFASASELLEACKALLEQNTHLELNLDGVELAEKAIKKATI